MGHEVCRSVSQSFSVPLLYNVLIKIVWSKAIRASALKMCKNARDSWRIFLNIIMKMESESINRVYVYILFMELLFSAGPSQGLFLSGTVYFFSMFLSHRSQFLCSLCRDLPSEASVCIWIL